MTSTGDLTGTWQNPPSIYRSAPFWSWNSKLDADRLCRAIESMHKAGMGGFFMHSRYGLKTPYLSEEWFACVRACIEKARQLDMKAYLYDEDRWPSGAAGGIVTRPNKDFRLHHLQASEPAAAPADAEHLSLFAIEVDDKGLLKSYRPIDRPSQAEAGQKVLSFDVATSEVSGWYNDGTYLDTMNRDAVAEFVRVTHQAYADRFGKDFGALVPAIFTDEPNYGTPQWGGPSQQTQWTPALPREFIRRRGYDLRDHLPELYYAKSPGEFSRVRHDYFRTLTELFVENFTAQVGRWCGKHGLALTGHMLAEENFESQITCVGAAMPHYEHMQWPGIDILRDQDEELSTAKQTASVADQLGRQRVLSELYGCTGWDWPLEGHKFVGDWQFAVGVNFRCPHLTHYSLAGGAKRDYPASIFSHSPWWKYYGAVEEYFGRLSFMLTQGKPVRDVLVIHPVESAWGCCTVEPASRKAALGPMSEEFHQIIRTLSGEHYDWDFGDESLLAKYAKVTGPAVKVGKMAYRLVVVPPAITLRATTVAMLNKFVAAGGKVLFLGKAPTHIDAKENVAAVGELLAKARTSGAKPEEFIGALESILPRRVSISENGAQQRCAWAMLRAIKGGQLLFVQSHDRKGARRVRVSVRGKRPVVLWDTVSGQRLRLKAEQAGDRAEFELELPPTGSALVSLGLSVPDAVRAAAELTVKGDSPIAGPFEIELTEPNTFPLDYCRYTFGDQKEFSQPLPVLKVDTLIRKDVGLGSRFGGEQQPWYLYAMGTVDTRPRGKAQMKWTFHVTDLPGKCALALEAPQDYRISVNGKAVSAVKGFWADEDIKTLDITSVLAKGDNTILLEFDYRPDMEIEEMYLVGDFGVARRDPAGPAAPGNHTLVALPRQLKLGSWVDQGLTFYGGGVKYRMTVERPKGRKRLRVNLTEALKLPGKPFIACTVAAIHVNGKTFVLPWPPYAADITDAMNEGPNQVIVELVGGRHNILGPLHTPWESWTGGDQFNPDNAQFRFDYYLVDHGLTAPVAVETLG